MSDFDDIDLELGDELDAVDPPPILSGDAPDPIPLPTTATDVGGQGDTAAADDAQEERTRDTIADRNERQI